MVTDADFIERKFRPQMVMDRLNRFTRHGTTSDIRLVGDDNQPVPGGTKPREGFGDTGEDFNRPDGPGWTWYAVTHEGAIDHAIAIQEYDTIAYRARDSHVVGFCCRAGCDTSRCQMTA